VTSETELVACTSISTSVHEWVKTDFSAGAIRMLIFMVTFCNTDWGVGGGGSGVSGQSAAAASSYEQHKVSESNCYEAEYKHISVNTLMLRML
jgi:hypothetical protein